jgi:hypothetical protein
MSGPILGDLSNKRWLGSTVRTRVLAMSAPPSHVRSSRVLGPSLLPFIQSVLVRAVASLWSLPAWQSDTRLYLYDDHYPGTGASLRQFFRRSFLGMFFLVGSRTTPWWDAVLFESFHRAVPVVSSDNKRRVLDMAHNHAHYSLIENFIYRLKIQIQKYSWWVRGRHWWYSWYDTALMIQLLTRSS